MASSLFPSSIGVPNLLKYDVLWLKEENITVQVKDEINERSYRCMQCRKHFDSKTGLLNHTRMHQTVKQYTCSLCHMTFPTNAELIEHKIVHKDEENLFLCKLCNMAFTDHCDFLVHETTHKKRSMYKCFECGSYQSPAYIKRHIATHFDCRVRCDQCDKTFQTPMGLKQHVLYEHKKEGKLIECVECGKMLKNKKEYDRHMANHTGIKKYQCLYCGKGFTRPLSRTVHTRTHTDERPFQCDQCDRTFKQYTDMKRHKLSHGGGKEIQCKVCDKKYKHEQSLKIHMRVHSQTDLYYCPVCDKACQNKQCLRVHMQYVHTTKRTFKCELCNVSFKTPRDINRHNESKAHRRAEYGAQRTRQAAGVVLE
ncbi:unnamed protein product [Diatraea saccharalis]|uniref:C2H2-type domain-containing protein n=1 Tax=Diatraea saccharalis TaxID=40085 RepID=A0A9N9R5J7_9NEOP|nr:unnamed protein product [Diatraea saccharalis]